MAWWRRDPSLFSRSPVHRCAQRVLRDHQATLRTRCFSRSPSKNAQHEDNGERKRPENMSNLEWMQLQHYERWRKRLQEDPYKTLFGASNDMLNGKGLMDWDWIHKSFPKWILNDMEVDDKPQEKSPERPKNPKRVETRDESPDTMPKARDSVVSRPYLRRARFERDESAGIVSPSDLRRPREHSHVKVVGHGSPGSRMSATAAVAPSADGLNNSAPKDVSSATEHHIPHPIDLSNDEVIARQPAALEARLAHNGLNGAAEGTSARDTPFMKEFLNNLRSEELEFHNAISDQGSWRQTAVQRRAATESTIKPQAQPSVPSTSIEKEASPALPSTIEPSQPLPAPFPRDQTDKTFNEGMNWRLKQESTSPRTEIKAQGDIPPARTPSDVLKQLPEDDIDFLSAADIRASMRMKRSRKPTEEQRQAERQSLEQAFTAAQDPPHLDPMLEAGVVNDQHVRRAEREKRAVQVAEQANMAESLKESHPHIPAADAPIESSIDRMKKWIETTGASFAKQFWQDPTEEADVTKTKLFFDKVANYIKKGQAATRHVTADLEKDVPASIPLLKRLRSDEQILDAAIHRLRQRSPSGTSQGISPRKIRAMQSLKTRFHQTNNELEKAYEALRQLAGTEAATNATGSFKRRLTAASTVLHKNSQLLRMLVWSLQARLEDPNVDRSILSNYKVVADNLLSLRDTQVTLMRLVERAMLVYNVVPNAPENLDAIKAEQSAEFASCEDPFVRARLAADAHLIDEIKASKIAKDAVSEEQVAIEPKRSTSTILNEPSPLAHSLFRPFGPAIEKLGSKEVQEQMKENETRKLRDTKLVDEIKQSYQERYRKINAEHKQVASSTMEHESSKQDLEKPIQMLKDDPEASLSISQDSPLVTASEPSKPTGDAEKQFATTSEQVTSALEKADAALKTTVTQPEPEFEPTSTTTPSQSMETLPTHYTIIVRDPQTDALSITTSTSGPPRDTSPAVPLHQALSDLDSPAKFIPYITSGLEVVSAKKDILVLRDAIDSSASTRPFETVRTSPATTSEQPDFSRDSINPIDGTTRLSPTGYVGPEETAEQLEKEFQERRQAASRMNVKENTQDEPRKGNTKEKKRGAGGVAKTAIWVAGMCYVAGVIGEIATGG
ncbi:hypothetical protein HBI72_102330 [Parastagonospora nodorum]|nr:hypothetical protein HBI72_102330 [Parastagonospora nodorum]